MKNFIGMFLFLIGIFLAIGSVGGLDRQTLELAQGITYIIIALVAMIIGGNLLKD